MTRISPADIAAARAHAAARITQAEAARLMGITRQRISYIIRREAIFWPVKRQGRRRAA